MRSSSRTAGPRLPRGAPPRGSCGALAAAGHQRARPARFWRRSDLGRPPCRARRVRHARLAEAASSRVTPVLARVATCSAAPGFTVAEFGDASAEPRAGRDDRQGLSRRRSSSRCRSRSSSCCSPSARSSPPACRCCSRSRPCSPRSGWRRSSATSSHAADATSSVILLIGMAVGVDYSLFYLKREREERAAAHGREALAPAAGDVGQAVLISGATVLIAMAGMLLAGSRSSPRSGSARWSSCSWRWSAR